MITERQNTHGESTVEFYELKVNSTSDSSVTDRNAHS